jgi:hypothetical protein
MDNDARILLTGTGNPNNHIVASAGAVYLDTLSGTIWHKQTGPGSTGWVPVPLSIGPPISGAATSVAMIFTNAGAPTNGTSGTGAGIAGPGSMCIDTTNFNLYLNGGTTSSPTWKLVTRAA